MYMHFFKSLQGSKSAITNGPCFNRIGFVDILSYIELPWDVQSSYFLLKKIRFAPWPDIMLSETVIYYWQEIFLLTLVSDSEAIL